MRLIFAAMLAVSILFSCSEATVTPDPLAGFKIKLGDESFIVQGSKGEVVVKNAPRTISTNLASLKVSIELENFTVALNAAPFVNGSAINLSTPKLFTLTPMDGSEAIACTLSVLPYSHDNQYGIYTPMHLSDIRNAPTSEYKIMNDITLPDTATYNSTLDPAKLHIADYTTNGWSALPAFSGILDGNNCFIKNLEIKRSDSQYQGFFTEITGTATVTKVKIETSTFGILASSFSGILAGQGNGNISSCYVAGKIEASGIWIGGLVGFALTGTFTDCGSGATVLGSGTRLGGLIGVLGNGSYFASASRCYSSATVTNSGTSADTGGLIGGIANGTLSNSWSNATVTSSSSRVGVLVGWSNGTIESCFTDGSAESTSGEVGGIAGYNQFRIINCYSASSLTAPDYCGGIAGTNVLETTKTDYAIKNSYSVSTLTLPATGTHFGPLVGSPTNGVTNCYYAAPSVTGSYGTAIYSNSTQASFAGFDFATAGKWIWVDAHWPTLNLSGVTQNTPALPTEANPIG